MNPIQKFLQNIGVLDRARLAAGTAPSDAEVKTWRCGTLTYTKMGLVTLFAFMIRGDFANVRMNAVIPHHHLQQLCGNGR